MSSPDDRVYKAVAMCAEQFAHSLIKAAAEVDSKGKKEVKSVLSFNDLKEALQENGEPVSVPLAYKDSTKARR